MIFLRKHRMIHALAALVAFYMLLASGRALIPGMCATLAALQTAQSCEIKGGVPSCCEVAAPSINSAPIWRGPAKPHPECAFCLLAKALVKSEAPVLVPGVPATPGAAIDLAVAPPDCSQLCAESRPRDPPSFV